MGLLETVWERLLSAQRQRTLALALALVAVPLALAFSQHPLQVQQKLSETLFADMLVS